MLFIGQVDACEQQNVAPLVWHGGRYRLSRAHPQA